MNYNMFDEIDYFTNYSENNSNNNNSKKTKNNTIKSNHNTSNNTLFNVYEGYTKGNLFQNLYDSYKNLKPVSIPVNSERDEMLLNIGELSFARHELNLLLDNYPNNNQALTLFNQYRNMEEEQVRNYERRFGPLTITSSDMKNVPFAWENDIWPWEI